MMRFSTAECASDGGMPEGRGLVVGIIYGAGRVLLVTTGPSRETVLEALAEWVRIQAAAKLRGRARDDVERLCAAGLHQRAVDAYLLHVSAAWDPEWVEVRAVPFPGSRERVVRGV